jgi:Alw26I/Eco31I/Esp3I family type II restriction m6 adenine DNA methyltransferase
MNNTVKPLFSDHYLTHRITETSEWNEDVRVDFDKLQSLYQQKRHILPNLNESQTENEWIQPILEDLGFSYIVQTSLHKSGKISRPDYSLFLNDTTKQDAYNLGGDETAFYSRVAVVADAKYYERPLSEKLKNETRDTFKNSNPSFQIVNYLDGTRVDWGILTNGRHWRLYYRLSASPIQQFYEIDLVKILLDNDVESFKYFWLFFRKKAFVKNSQNLNFLERVREESTSYARQIEGELKKLVFDHVFANLAGGFVAYQYSLIPQNHLNKGGLEESSQIYQATLSFLYKILFLLYAEAKSLFPVEQESYREYSLSLLLKNIAKKCDKKQIFSETSTQYYDRLLSLFKIIDRGDKSLNVPAYNGGLFKVTGDSVSATNQFLLQHKLTDHILAPALDQLARIKGEWIDYKFLGVRDLGTIYEGLLEYKLVIDDAETGKVHLENDKGERRETGSYYTPEYIVNYIVQNTLDPILEQRETQFQQLMTEINQLLKQLQDCRRAAKTIRILRQDLDKLQRKAYDTLLDIKVCDPAMGSGHFLVTTVDYITRKLINILNNYPENNPILEQLERIKEDIINNLKKQGISVNYERLSPDNLLHRAVMKRCIYGVDLNPMAVELAKVSLWLHSFTIGAPLSFLDHHLRCGNSLIGCMAKDVQNEFMNADATEGFLPLFQTPFHGLLQSANVMQEIANLSDATFEQVEQSQHYFNSFDTEAKPYKKLLDVYISQYFGLKLKEVNSFFRFRLNDLKAQANQSDQKLLETARKLYEEKRFFHWDLEFPEVFIDLAHADWKENGGFDVVLGNPPYDELSEVALGRKIDEISYFKSIPALDYAVSNRVNLYRLFIARALQIFRLQGLHSFIIPLSLLADQFALKLRRYILETQQIKIIEQFPQKDDPNNRVFFEAKLSTCIYILTKNISQKENQLYIRTHQGKYLENNSPFFIVNQNDFFKFDSDNLSIPGLSQTEWNIVLNFTNHKNLTKLNNFAKANTGELMINKEFNPYLSNFAQGEEIIRGSHIGMYQIVEPKQGETLYFDRKKYLQEHLETKKAYHHQNSRVVYQRYAAIDNFRRLIATVLPSNYFCSHTVGYLTIINKNCKQEFLLALLNSQLLDWRFDLTSSNNNINGYEIESLPIPKINFTTPDPDRATFLTHLTQIYDNTVAQASRLSQLGKDRLEAYPTIVQHLQQNQTDVIHDFLAYLAEQMIELNKQKQTESKDFFTWLIREIGTDIDNLTNKTTIKNYLGDYQKKQEHLTFAQFLDILKKNRKKLTIDPSERKIQNLLSQEYEASLNTLLPIKNKLQYTDNLIDEIVYKLYGLTDEEIEIVEGNNGNSQNLPSPQTPP